MHYRRPYYATQSPGVRSTTVRIYNLMSSADCFGIQVTARDTCPQFAPGGARMRAAVAILPEIITTIYIPE